MYAKVFQKLLWPQCNKKSKIPSCLNETILSAKLNGIEVKSLLDTGASNSFVNETIAKSAKLQVYGKPSCVCMAFDQLIAFVLDKVCTSLSAQGNEYPNVSLV